MGRTHSEWPSQWPRNARERFATQRNAIRTLLRGASQRIRNRNGIEGYSGASNERRMRMSSSRGIRVAQSRGNEICAPEGENFSEVPRRLYSDYIHEKLSFRTPNQPPQHTQTNLPVPAILRVPSRPRAPLPASFALPSTLSYSSDRLLALRRVPALEGTPSRSSHIRRALERSTSS